MKYRIIICVIVFILIVFLINLLGYTHAIRNIEKAMNKLNLEKYNKLMIVAHPDDEMLWGGKELLKEKYLVVCITCGKNKRRAKEFKNAMKKTNNKYLMLGYPDKIFGIRSKWLVSSYFIKRDLNKIINYKDWEKVVTHNRYGEYGHIHHIKTHRIVLSIIEKDKIKQLYVFGEYCSKKSIIEHRCKLKITNSIEDVTTIEDIIRSTYYSQKKVIEKFKLMLQYENIHKYKK